MAMIGSNNRDRRQGPPGGLWLTLLGWLVCSGCQSVSSPEVVDFPAGDLPNRQGLVSVYWLKKLLDHGTQPDLHLRPPTYEQERFVVIEASWATLENASDYQRGHIPGAIHVNTDLFETGDPQWRLKPLEELQQVIGDLGITPQTTVIVYGEKLIAAARVWWILSYAGVMDVRLLDGDMQTWQAAGFLSELSVNRLSPVAFSSAPRQAWLIDSAEVRAGIDESLTWSLQEPLVGSGGPQHYLMLDVRSWPEYIGQRSGYSYLDACGRIPTARWLGDADDSSGIYKRSDGRLQSPPDVFAHWRSQGLATWPIDDSTNHLASPQVVFYCGGGWRSSVAFFYAWLAGTERLRNYSDGWSGWSTDYVADPSAGGSTPGFRQVPTAHPRVTGSSP
jgi:3-mercaptopyruvate sulfurtransferase SseA